MISLARYKSGFVTVSRCNPFQINFIKLLVSLRVVSAHSKLDVVVVRLEVPSRCEISFKLISTVGMKGSLEKSASTVVVKVKLEL